MLISIFKTFSAESFTEICTAATAAARQWKAKTAFSATVCLQFLKTGHSDTWLQLTWGIHSITEWLRLEGISRGFSSPDPCSKKVKQEHFGQGFLQCFLNASKNETPKHLWTNSSVFEQLTVNFFVFCWSRIFHTSTFVHCFLSTHWILLGKIRVDVLYTLPPQLVFVDWIIGSSCRTWHFPSLNFMGFLSAVYALSLQHLF